MTYDPSTRNVLIIEDDNFLRVQYVEAVRRRGFSVIEAHDGIEGIKQLGLHSIQAVVLDLMMPRLDGYHVIDYILQQRAALLPYVIVVSSRPDTIFRSIYGVLKKPFEARLLGDTVVRCLQEREEA